MISRKPVKQLFWITIALAFGAALRAGPLPSDHMLRSVFELQSLRSLLRQEGAWTRLYKLAERYPIWTLSTVSAGLTGCDEGGENGGANPPQPGADPGSTGGEAEPRTFQHSFVFASRKGLSSRAYQTTFRSCKQDQGGHLIQAVASKFVTRRKTSTVARAMVPGPVSLKIFRAAVDDAQVTKDLADVLTNNSISVVRTSVKGALDTAGPTYREYNLEFGTRLNGETEPRILLRYEVVYDLAAGEVREISGGPSDNG